jgi:AraC-like DNA-binding protein
MAAGSGLLSSSAASGWQALGPVLSAADELAACPDIGLMLQRAVEITREQFGLERVGLYLRDPRSDRVLMRGTWGTSATRQTTNEYGYHHDCSPSAAEYLCGLQRNGALWHQVERKLQCLEDPRRDAELGVGWLVVTPIVAACELIGVMYNDSALSRSPVNELQQVRTAVFCSHLAALLLHRRARFEWAIMTRPANAEGVEARVADSRIARVLRAIEAAGPPGPSLAELSHIACLSPSRLAHVFKEQTGISVLTAVNRVRLSAAQLALQDSAATLQEAAERCGFATPYSFSKWYLKQTGLRPGEYQRRWASRLEGPRTNRASRK